MSVYVAPEVWNAPATLVTPAHTLTFNDATGDTYQHDASKCSGLLMPAGRSVVDDKPQTHGAIVHPTLMAGRRITAGGVVRVRSADFFTIRDAMLVTLGEALVSILDADGTYSWTVAGATYSVGVRCEITASPNGTVEKTYLFGLIAGDPTVTVT